jgi:hypothetical protein
MWGRQNGARRLDPPGSRGAPATVTGAYAEFTEYLGAHALQLSSDEKGSVVNAKFLLTLLQGPQKSLK